MVFGGISRTLSRLGWLPRLRAQQRRETLERLDKLTDGFLSLEGDLARLLSNQNEVIAALSELSDILPPAPSAPVTIHRAGGHSSRVITSPAEASLPPSLR